MCAIPIRLHLLAQLKSSLGAKRHPSDHQIWPEEDDLLQGVFCLLAKDKAVVRVSKDPLEFLPDRLMRINDEDFLGDLRSP